MLRMSSCLPAHPALCYAKQDQHDPFGHPLYVTPFEDICGNGFQDVNDDIQKILAIDHPHPMIKFTKKDHEKLET